LKRDINLTHEIKEYILENHAYVESNPVAQPPSVTQILNTHNNMINYIANMSTVTKLNELIAYNNAELTDFETKPPPPTHAHHPPHFAHNGSNPSHPIIFLFIL
jgi:hypothetical protein